MSLLVLGDSAGAGVGAEYQEQALLGRLIKGLQRFSLRWELWAKTGHSTLDTIDEIRRRPPNEFDVVVVSLGVNDLTTLTPLFIWLQGQRTLIRILQSRQRTRLIILSGLPPIHAFPLLPEPLRFCLGIRARLFTWALGVLVQGEEGVRMVKLDQNFTVDMMSADGFHPGPPIYAIWSQSVIKEIRM